IGIIVAQAYRERRKSVQFSCWRQLQETATVDVLSDDWGQLGLVDRSAALLLKPLHHAGQAKDEMEDEEEEDEEQSSPDILKLQMLQRKMMRRIHERRAAAAAAESPLQRFLRHYHARLQDLYPEEAQALEESLGNTRRVFKAPEEEPPPPSSPPPSHPPTDVSISDDELTTSEET
ncbi:hypothetical protein Hamer_G005068, partial [Homarus americanus]